MTPTGPALPASGGSASGGGTRAGQPHGDVDRTLAALADETRRRIVEELSAGPKRAGDLARILDKSAASMSRHLRVLRRGGLVFERSLPDDARVRVYRLSPERFTDLRQWIEEVERYWGGQLAALKAHVENAESEGSGRGDGE